MDTTEAQLLSPEIAADLLDLRDRVAQLEARLAIEEAAVRPFLGYGSRDERDVVPPLALDPGPRLSIGDAVVADLNLGGLIKGRVVGFRGADVVVDGGKLGAHCVDPRRVIVCPGEWVK